MTIAKSRDSTGLNKSGKIKLLPNAEKLTVLVANKEVPVNAEI